MKFIITNGDFGTNFEFKAETAEEAADLMDICINTRRDPTDISLDFTKGVTMQMWTRKVTKPEQTHFLERKKLK